MGHGPAVERENTVSGHRLSVWIEPALLGALVGAAMASRPCYWPAWPLVMRLILGIEGVVAVVTWASLVAGSIAIGWTPEHLVGGLAVQVAWLMVLFSCVGAVVAQREDVWLLLGIALCLPGLWASNAAYHLILALPFLLAWRGLR